MNPPSLTHWSPPPGALEDYIRYWTPTTDAPRLYHIACGLVTLAATVENRVYLQFGGDRIFPNLWVLILGPSSFYRKTSSLNKARRVLHRLHDGEGLGPLLPDEFSREALLRRLAERPQGVLTFSEFSGALAQFSKDYMSGTQQLLADLYDSPPLYSRVVGPQTFTLKGVCLSVLAASQTDWFTEKVKSTDMRGGFLARFTYWPAFEKADFLAVPPPPDVGLGNQLLARLNVIRQLKGAVQLEPPAADYYGRWVEMHERELHGAANIADLSPFWSRLSIIVLKVSMLLAISHRVDLRVGIDAVKQAIEIAEFLKRSLRHLFKADFAFTPGMKDRQKLLRLIANHPGGIKRRDLLRASSMLARAFDDITKTLIQEETVVLHDGKFHLAEDDDAA